MTPRTESPPNPLAVAWIIAGTIGALWVILLWHHRELLGWVIAVYVVCGVLGLLLMGYERWERKGETDTQPDRLDALEVECLELLAENARLHALADEAALLMVDPGPPTLAPGERPELYVIPAQRMGEHDRLALSIEEWDAIQRETEGWS